MVRGCPRRALGMLGAACLVLVALGAAKSKIAPNNAPPTLVRAVSRLTHGSAGTFDIPLPQGPGGSAIECRDVSRGMKLLLIFDQPISSANVAVTAGVAKLSAKPKFSTNHVTIALS